jgi:hypothetical protein
MKKIFFLHIGYPRTGTKTFQTHFFPNHPDINYLGRHPKRKELGHAHINVLNTIMIVSDEIFQINKNFIIDEVKKLSFSENKINIASSEFFILSECLYDGLSETDDKKILKKTWFEKKRELNNESNISLERTISRLKIILDDLQIELKVFFSIREQCSEILSLYTASSPEDGSSFPISSNLFLDNIKKEKKNHFVRIFLNTFNYFKKYEAISKIVGKKNLKILVYEDLKYKKDHFLRELSNFLEIDFNISMDLINKSVHENSTSYLINENTNYNSVYKVILAKFNKNLFNPQENFNINLLKKKIGNLLNFVKRLFLRNKDNNNLLKKNNLTENRLNLQKNFNLIKKIYYKDNILLDKKINLNLKDYNYH